MANKRPNKLLDKIIATNVSRARKDIRQWRVALQMAENPDNPNRTLLYSLYDELELDTHVTSEKQNRILRLQGSKFGLYDDSGEINEEKTKLLNKPFFHDFLEEAMESLFWGHSLMQLGDVDVNGLITDLTLINRRHVTPEFGVFRPEVGSDRGRIFYRESPQYYDWLLEVGNNKDLGLLNKAAPHVLYKRFAQSAWSEFTEVFGMPIRIGKTNAKDEESLNRMENMMITMGTAFYAVIDDNEKIEFVESAKSNGEVYDSLITRCNSEISKLINGAVIGEASEGGSRSKEEVGERTGEVLTQADKMFIASYVNYKLLPKLVKLGYPFQGLEFKFQEDKNIKALWEMVSGLLPHKEVDNEFISQTFGIPVKDKEFPDYGNFNAVREPDKKKTDFF